MAKIYSYVVITPYQKLTRHDIPCTCDYRDPDPQFCVDPAPQATAEEFEALEAITQAIRAGFPEAEVVLREHQGWCDNCREGEDDTDAIIYRKSVLVTVRVGEIDFSRAYAV